MKHQSPNSYPAMLTTSARSKYLLLEPHAKTTRYSIFSILLPFINDKLKFLTVGFCMQRWQGLLSQSSWLKEDIGGHSSRAKLLTGKQRRRCLQTPSKLLCKKLPRMALSMPLLSLLKSYQTYPRNQVTEPQVHFSGHDVATSSAAPFIQRCFCSRH